MAAPIPTHLHISIESTCFCCGKPPLRPDDEVYIDRSGGVKRFEIKKAKESVGEARAKTLGRIRTIAMASLAPSEGGGSGGSLLPPRVTSPVRFSDTVPYLRE